MSITALLITRGRQTTAGYGLVGLKEQNDLIEARHRAKRVSYISGEAAEISGISCLRQLI